jgi:VanZ family protein
MRRENLIHTIRYWVPLYVYMGLMCYVSHQNDPLGGRQLPVSDKLVHGLEYMILAVLCMRACVRARAGWVRRFAWQVSLIGCMLFACFDEYHQSYIVGRTASIGDIYADIGGISAGVLAAGVLFMLRHRVYGRA